MKSRELILILMLCADILTSELQDDLGDLFITTSATNKHRIEINWNLTRNVDEIRLYTTPGPYEISTPAKHIIKPKNQTDFYVTNETLSLDKIPYQWRKLSSGSRITLIKGPMNLGYCISTIENNRITKTNCLKIQPTWMTDNGAVIGDIPLTELFIPGTHDSGSYENNQKPLSELVSRFVYTQDVDVWTQLVFGIRYLDFRIGYYNTTGLSDSFWVNHGICRVNPLRDLFREIKIFLERAEDEIVILDFHEFPVGFKNLTTHKQLTDLIDTELGDIAISRDYQNLSKGPTLNDLWKQKGRLIICYGDANITHNSKYLWDPLIQKWGNKQKLEDLKQYLLEIRSNHDSQNSDQLWASMAELTETFSSIIFEGLTNPNSYFKSIAYMADLVNRNLNDWYRHRMCDVNIVATDFFLGNDLINIALECNLRNGK